ncbi:hypothetical protein TVAG_407900 [Trichomonas vaginalis G3]|uniref:Uncharacterized protein n=1 Tax=Trichomonas vaginalis (strain ATCC PRA-98 / G3) TaxID=412133 RepID=A2FNM1_TRIV3|nr:hypothetical protein TVAGG3_0386170 [Trichomonas vaginalis G3]EAX93489.1 hypothetical protein TVAG_407900 [Trichomonas vaginalis G3]KAI5533649.1 hypothetical protein TVAGG3_0386170 [Trichomonas vaginalis G3]|eukprot:XP_001306419.1 hypothetical protein [Trichomonas vaginalis G3]
MNLEEGGETTKYNKYNARTDQDLMLEINAKLEKEAQEDLENHNERVVLEGDEDYKIVDGVKVVPFSLVKELKEGTFKDGKYIDNSDEEDESSYVSDGDSDNTKVDIKQLLIKLISLIKPQTNITDALVDSSKDQDRMAQITDIATQLLFIKEYTNIYNMDIEELQEKLDKFDAQK